MRFFCIALLALLSLLSVSEGVRYSQPLQGDKDFIYLHGGVKFTPVSFADACVAKTYAKEGSSRNALFLVGVPVNDVALAICSGASGRGPNGWDPYLLGTRKVNSPDMVVTTQTYPLSPPCAFTETDWGEKRKLTALTDLWDNYDGYCQEEFGADYRAARAQEALFYLDGSSPVLGKGVALAGHHESVIANVRGGYLFWASGAFDFADGTTQSYHIPWTVGAVYSDCFTGLLRESMQEWRKYSEQGDNWCTSPYRFQNGYLNDESYIPGSYATNARAPILCRRIDAPVKMSVTQGYNQHGFEQVIIPTRNNGYDHETCSSLFGLSYYPMNPAQLSTQLKSVFLDIREFGNPGPFVSVADISIPLGSYTYYSPYYAVYQDGTGLLKADNVDANNQFLCGLRQSAMCQNMVEFVSEAGLDGYDYQSGGGGGN